MNEALAIWMMFVWLMGAQCGPTLLDKPDLTNLPKIEVTTKVPKGNEELRGYYDNKTDSIVIYFNYFLEETIVHEMTHACQQRSGKIPVKIQTIADCDTLLSMETEAFTIENKWRKIAGEPEVDIKSILLSYALICYEGISHRK
jgi:hypothetical protein